MISSPISLHLLATMAKNNYAFIKTGLVLHQSQNVCIANKQRITLRFLFKPDEMGEDILIIMVQRRLNGLLKAEQKQTNWTDYTARKGIRLAGLVLEDRNGNWTGYSGAETTAGLVIVGQMITGLVKVYFYFMPLPLELVSILIFILEAVAAACPARHLML